MKPSVVLILSVAANIALAAFIFGRRPATSAEMPHSIAGVTTSTVASAHAEVDSVFGETRLSRFHWSQLESTDYKEYIARLRAFGVPETVVRDILIADVNKLYRARFTALRPPRKPKNANFWELRNRHASPDRDLTADQREQMRTLRKDQTELIKELLGVNVYEDIAKESGLPDWTERTYGSLPKELRDRVSEMHQRFQDAQAEIYAKNDGIGDMDTQAEIAVARRNLRAELATVLTPEQLEEYELRNSQTAQQMRWELSWFEPSEQEFRAIHTVKQVQDEVAALLQPAVKNSEAVQEEIQALQKRRAELDKTLEEAMGSQRWREYQLNNQWEFSSLLQSGVSAAAVLRIVDVRSEVDKATAQLHSNQSLSAEQRAAAFEALKVETDRTLVELLGERRAKLYSAQGGRWVQNIVAKPRTP